MNLNVETWSSGIINYSEWETRGASIRLSQLLLCWCSNNDRQKNNERTEKYVETKPFNFERKENEFTSCAMNSSSKRKCTSSKLWRWQNTVAEKKKMVYGNTAMKWYRPINKSNFIRSHNFGPKQYVCYGSFHRITAHCMMHIG